MSSTCEFRAICNSIQCEMCCLHREWVSHFPINNPKMLWFRTWYLYRNLPFSCPEKVHRELGITSDGRPAPDWTNKVKCTLYCPGQGIFSSHFDNFYTSKLIWGWVVRMHSSTPWSRLWREPAKMLKSIWTHMIDVINHAFRKPNSVDRFYPRKL